MNTMISQPSRWVSTVALFNTYMSQNLLGGPKVIKMAWVINLHKALTLPLVGALMLTYQNFSIAVWAYLALHGTYGLCWLLKHFAFRM